MSWNRNIIHVGALNLRKGTVSAQLGSCLVNPTLTITQKNKTIKTIQYDVRKPITIKETIRYLREFRIHKAMVLSYHSLSKTHLYL